MRKFLTIREAAAMLGVSKDYIRNAGVPCLHLPPGRSGKRGIRRYTEDDLAAWAEQFRERVIRAEHAVPIVDAQSPALERKSTYGLRRPRKGRGGILTTEVRQITSPMPRDNLE